MEGVISSPEVRDGAVDAGTSLRELLSGRAPKNGRVLDYPFTFRTRAGLAAVAQGRGLEGFYFSKQYLEEKFDPMTFSHYWHNYFEYTDYLLMRRAASTYGIRQILSSIKNKPASSRRSLEFNNVLGAYISGLQKSYLELRPSRWALKARIYELFPRAYNLSGRRGQAGGKTVFFRDFDQRDFDSIKAMGFDTVWPMGIYPVGLRGRTGSGGGSAYAIRDHEAINPDLGTEDDFRNFVAKAHAAGLKVIIDFVPNHTSQDSTLLAEDPAYFIHMPAANNRPENAPPAYFGYRSGENWLWVRTGGYYCDRETLCSWSDVAQLDYSNPRLWERQKQIALRLVRRFDVDGFRVDMAYQLLSGMFAKNWERCMPPGEFLSELMSAVRAEKPSLAFIAEAYANQEELSDLGFDLIYNKSEWGRPEGSAGWYDGLANIDPLEVAAALQRAAFLTWRKGGAGALNFFINHDEPAAEKVFGKRLPAIAAATMFLPGAFLFYNGAEIGFDAAVPGESKTIPFSVPVSIDWSGGNPESRALFERLFKEAAQIRSELGDYYIKPLPQLELEGWGGYVLQSKDSPRLKKALVFNYGAEPVTVDLKRLNIKDFAFTGELEVGGYRLLQSLPK
ncbi:MAG TPA: alpha-amylase family glycosyl hydrolase [Elusimicrobiales bacterium]|nr:alpha-amylase family glycosyl hydrolase [Elusimicrobiales bacterium]